MSTTSVLSPSPRAGSNYFTPRTPLGKLSSSSTNSLTSPGGTPVKTPSRKRIKIEDAPITTVSDPNTCRKSVEGPNVLEEKSTHEECLEEQTANNLRRVAPRVRPHARRRILLRELNGIPSTAGGRPQAHHCANWSEELLNYYSTPSSIHVIRDPLTSAQVLPFSLKSLNRAPLVSIGDEQGFIRLLDPSSFSESILTIPAHAETVFDHDFSPDDFTLATASGDRDIKIFDMTTQNPLFVLRQHTQSVRQIQFNQHNPMLLTSVGRDGSLMVWDLRITGVGGDLDDGKKISFLKPTINVPKAHNPKERSLRNRTEYTVTCARWLNLQQIATAGDSDAAIKVWDIRSSAKKMLITTAGVPPQHEHSSRRHHGITALTVSPDGSRTYALCRDGVMYAYSTSHLSAGPLHAYSHPRLHANTFYVRNAISKDGRKLATGSSDGVICVFGTDEKYFDAARYGDFAMGKGDCPAAGVMSVGRGKVLVGGHGSEVTDVCWTEDGSCVGISDDMTARTWKEGEQAAKLREGGGGEGRRWGCGWAE